MSKNVSKSAVSVPALSVNDALATAKAELAKYLVNNPAIAAALATETLLGGNRPVVRRRGTVSPSQGETELDRMLRCAHFVQASERRTILSDLFARLGDNDKVVVTETDLCKSTGYRSPVLRRSLDIVSQRLNDYDTEYTAKYPEVLDIGYTILVEGDRAHARTVTFARAKAKAKGKAIAPRNLPRAIVPAAVAVAKANAKAKAKPVPSKEEKAAFDSIMHDAPNADKA